MKDLGVDETMCNLTSASSEVSASSGTKNGTAGSCLYPLHSSTSTIQEPQPKKKRNLPGHPDPEAEVIALSPNALLATNRFICDICNKGFQRDQNLQLHRRGHNLPWKLKPKSSKETRKKVYVCPEPTCVHHEPSRALGDLTGIKKHFCRKHGEKKWKCEKCSKRYAVQSDWKAHSKICSTREYKCDCGTIFSRRDSFNAHRAFCNALAQESAKPLVGVNPLVSSHIQHQSHGLQVPSIKKEQEINLRQEIPPWLAYPPPGQSENPNPTILFPSFQSITSSHYMSATALLQKASQIGATMSTETPSQDVLRPHQQAHVPELCTTEYSSLPVASFSTVSGLNMPSREDIGNAPFAHGLASYGNKAGITSELLEKGATNNTYTGAEAPSLIHDMMDSTMTFERSSFEEAFGGIMNPTRDVNFQELESQFSKSNNGITTGANGETRDFLGLGVFSQRDIFNVSGFDHLGSSSCGKQDQNQPPWQS